MEYMIAHLLRGEAKKQHERITTELAERFDLYPLHERIQPHLSLNCWFESENVNLNKIYQNLDSFVTNHKQSDYHLSGFGSFSDEVIYMNAEPSEKMSATVKSMLDHIKAIEGVEFGKYYKYGDDFHASVARNKLKPFNFNEVWNYLQTIDDPNFQMKFDNIAILKKDNNTWTTDRIFELKPE